MTKYNTTRSKAIVCIPLGLTCYDDNGYKCKFLNAPSVMGTICDSTVNLYWCGYFDKCWLAIDFNPLKCVECLNKFKTS